MTDRRQRCRPSASVRATSLTFALVAGACSSSTVRAPPASPSIPDAAAKANAGLDASVEGGSVDAGFTDGNDAASVAGTTPIVGTPLATFASGLEGFTLNTFSEPGANLANVSNPATLTWISTDGSPDPGCLKVTAPYSASGQWVDVETLVSPAVDWSGRTLHVRIKLDPSSAFSGYARLYVKTGAAYTFYPMAYPPYPPNSGWQEFVLPLAAPDAAVGLDPTHIMAFGVDPETTSPSPTPVTFYVDSFSIE